MYDMDVGCSLKDPTASMTVGQNGNRHVYREIDRQSGRNLGVARLVASAWQVGAAKRGKGRE